MDGQGGCMSRFLFSAVIVLQGIVVGQGVYKPGPPQPTYFVVGDVGQPGTYPLSVPIKVSDGIRIARGILNPITDTIVIRRGDQEIEFNLTALREGKNIEQDIPL